MMSNPFKWFVGRKIPWPLTWFWSFMIWTWFQQYRYEDVPEKYFWVLIAKCECCGAQITLQRGMHADPRTRKGVLEHHIFVCTFRRKVDIGLASSTYTGEI